MAVPGKPDGTRVPVPCLQMGPLGGSQGGGPAWALSTALALPPFSCANSSFPQANRSCHLFSSAREGRAGPAYTCPRSLNPSPSGAPAIPPTPSPTRLTWLRGSLAGPGRQGPGTTGTEAGPGQGHGPQEFHVGAWEVSAQARALIETGHPAHALGAALGALGHPQRLQGGPAHHQHVPGQQLQVLRPLPAERVQRPVLEGLGTRHGRAWALGGPGCSGGSAGPRWPHRRGRGAGRDLWACSDLYFPSNRRGPPGGRITPRTPPFLRAPGVGRALLNSWTPGADVDRRVPRQRARVGLNCSGLPVASHEPPRLPALPAVPGEEAGGANGQHAQRLST